MDNNLGESYKPVCVLIKKTPGGEELKYDLIAEILNPKKRLSEDNIIRLYALIPTSRTEEFCPGEKIVALVDDWKDKGWYQAAYVSCDETITEIVQENLLVPISHILETSSSSPEDILLEDMLFDEYEHRTPTQKKKYGRKNMEKCVDIKRGKTKFIEKELLREMSEKGSRLIYIAQCEEEQLEDE